jgi:steroid 5-alpha reductase family enzyme
MGEILMIGFGTVFTMMLILWIIHLRIKNAGIVDVGWGLGFILLSCVYATMGEPTLRSRLMVVMVGLWGIRIIQLLLHRIFTDKEEDKRYQKIRSEWGPNINLKFFFFFELQTVIQIIMAAPLLLVCLNPSSGLSVLEIIGIIVFGVSLVGETIADQQLKDFKSNLENKGKVCNIGLWNYSRHPNYFFEWMIWVGIYIFACGSPSGWTTFYSPLIILFLVLKVSGVPMAEEQSIKSRGDLYREYQRTTSVFIPLPKRKL